MTQATLPAAATPEALARLEAEAARHPQAEVVHLFRWRACQSSDEGLNWSLEKVARFS